MYSSLFLRSLRSELRPIWTAFAVLLLSTLATLCAADVPEPPTSDSQSPIVLAQTGESPHIAQLDLRDIRLGDAMRLLARQTALNIVPSRAAADRSVTVFMTNVPALVAVEAMCRANNLWYQYEPQYRLVRIFTVQEYRSDLSTFRTEDTRVFNLRFPNALAIGYALRDLYGDRLLLSLGADEREIQDDLERRLDRFGLMNRFSDRIRGTDDDRRTSNDNRDQNEARSNQAEHRVRVVQPTATEILSAELIQRMQDQEGGADAESAKAAPGNIDAIAALQRAAMPDIYVSIAHQHNQLAVRTSDRQAIADIATLIDQLDVPTPIVMLQVQVLSVELGDGLSSVFDYQFASGRIAGGFASGSIVAPTPGSLSVQGSGLTDGAVTAQFVGAEFAARLQLLKEQNRVTSLATPMLLTANNEVSGLFIGDDRPIVIGFSEPVTITSNGGTTTLPGAPITEIQEVGTTLLLTPTVNADRTVTLRILQENSNVSSIPARILVPTANGSVVSQDVDVVQRRTLSGTVVAKDRHLIAIGGLIEERSDTQRASTPILGDLPGIGLLFRRETQSTSRRELVLLIQPYVLQPSDEAAIAAFDPLKDLLIHPNRPSANPPTSAYKPEDAVTPSDLRQHPLN